MSTFLAERRRQMLNAATEDTLRWCARPEATVIGNHPTDQFWVQAFAPSARRVEADMARRFLDTLKLATVDWDHVGASRIINDLRGSRDFLPERDIPELVQALRGANRQGVQCTLVASKLANFVFPTAEVYIWHELTGLVLLAERQPPSARPRLPVPAGYDRLDSCDYVAFHAACRQTLVGEMAQEDFVEAARLVTGLLRAVPGPLADPAVPDAFFQRYLLAKLLFHECWHLRYGQMAHTMPEASPGGADASATGSRVYERLSSYVRPAKWMMQ
jgi:hypothetical protein